jgi:hypothetical protein
LNKKDKIRKENLMDVKYDIQEELKLLEEMKQKQIVERQKYEAKKDT